mmetsp:Transcript_20538/g.52149  ORF Transcript_20538/g.52149 Transcript_20538/m.52149 type:complete len:246 (+) Transcript_20538:616-1353(+)
MVPELLPGLPCAPLLRLRPGRGVAPPGAAPGPPGGGAGGAGGGDAVLLLGPGRGGQQGPERVPGDAAAGRVGVRCAGVPATGDVAAPGPGEVPAVLLGAHQAAVLCVHGVVVVRAGGRGRGAQQGERAGVALDSGVPGILYPARVPGRRQGLHPARPRGRDRPGRRGRRRLRPAVPGPVPLPGLALAAVERAGVRGAGEPGVLPVPLFCCGGSGDPGGDAQRGVFCQLSRACRGARALRGADPRA